MYNSVMFWLVFLSKLNTVKTIYPEFVLLNVIANGSSNEMICGFLFNMNFLFFDKTNEVL